MGFDNPIRNYGSVDLNNVSFINNDLPICNYGELTCNECSFLYNKGVQSAGIFITHSSHNFITNCIFKYNVLISSDEVVDICVDGDSVVYVFTLNGFNEKPICKCLNDGKVIFKNYTNSITRNLTVNSNFDIGKLGNELLRDNGESEVLNINFAPYFYNSVAFKKGSSFHSNNTYYFLHPHNKLVVINGNGGTVRLRYAEDRAATHFLVCDKDVTVVINNLTIIGFNTAIYNYGNMILNNVTFAENRLKYVHDFDVGGAIINYGVLTCINCSFINNYAQYGGAIFSNGSSSRLNLTNCFFENNTAYVGENGDCGFWKFMIKGNNYVQKKNDVVYLKGGSDVMVGGNSIVFAYHLDGNSTPNSEIKFGWDDSPENTFVLRDSFNPIIKEFVVNDDSSLQDVANSIWNDNTTVDLFIVNITGNLSISPDDVNLFIFIMVI